MISIRSDVKISSAIKRVVKKTIKITAKIYSAKSDVSVLITNDEFIKALNSDFRGIEKATDVLSFPAEEEGFLGDIAISINRAQAQAKEYGHSLEREISFLTVHAMLHLLGYDHIEEDEETDMRQRQRQVMKKMGYDIK